MTKRICLDAGHYGKRNQSPAVKTYYESVVMWDLHLLLKEELERYGFTVVTTRQEQKKDLDVYKRGALSKKSDLFLSLHSNAVGKGVDDKTDRVSVFHLMEDEAAQCDDVSRAFARKIAPVIVETMGVSKYKILTKKAGNDRNKDGVMNDNYYGVLHGARMVGTPGLILEHSFHSNTRSANWLLDPENLRRLARAEAKCIAEFFGVQQKEVSFSLEMRELAKGWTGDAVQALQALLEGRGYALQGENGVFGTATENALRAFQKEKGLTVDGIAGKMTMAALLGL